MVSKTENTGAHVAANGEDFAPLVSFQERTRDLIMIVDPAGAIVYASPSWHVLGWGPDELPGTAMLDVVHPHDRETGERAIVDVLAGDSVEGITVRLRRKDGAWVWHESSATPIAASTGGVAYIVATARDVSEREELRRRLTEVDALYRVAAAIGRATSLDDLFAEAVDILIEATGAARASVLLAGEDKVMRCRASRGLSAGYRAAAEGHSPWAPDAADPEPVLVPDVRTAGFPEELERAARAEGIESLAFVPLLHGGRLIGQFMLYRDEPYAWSDAEVLLCSNIASHLASATVRTEAQAGKLVRDMTAAKRTEESARQSMALIESVFRTVPVGLAFWDTKLRYVRVNEALESIYGVTASELLGRSLFELRPEYSADLTPVIQQVLDSGSPVLDLELTGERRDEPGVRRVWVMSFFPVRDPTGELLGVGCSTSDVTAERSALADHVRAEDRIRFLARASDLLNETLDHERTLTALAEMLVPMLAGQVVIDLVEDDGSMRCVAAAHMDPAKSAYVRDLRRRYPPTAADHPVQRAVRTGDAVYLANVQEHVDEMAHDPAHAEEIRELANTSGIVVPLIARGRTLGAIQLGTVDPQPRFTQQDLELAIELARRASLALDNARLYGEAQARAHAAAALEFVDDGVFLLDADEVIRLWNPAAAQTFQVKPAKAIGRPAGELIRDWDSVHDRIHIASEPSSGARRPQTIPVSVQGEERWLSISAVRFPGGTVYAFRDLTEERAVDQLKSDFVATVSHELRTPLAAIYGAALTLQRDDVRLEESQRDGLLDVVASEADRLARIVNDILWASRLDSGQMGVSIESCDAAKLVNQVAGALRSHAPADVELVVDAPEGLPAVATDPDKLRQVLTNLVDNAVKYSPDGGRVLIAVSHAGNRIRFRIEDHGLGIPPAEQTRIFEKFFRVDPSMTRGVGGTGLGLYICRELVDRMQGRISVASDGRSGSTFSVELPVA